MPPNQKNPHWITPRQREERDRRVQEQRARADRSRSESAEDGPRERLRPPTLASQETIKRVASARTRREREDPNGEQESQPGEKVFGKYEVGKPCDPTGTVGSMVPDWLNRRPPREITSGEKLTYGYLQRRWNKKLGCAFCSQPDIAESCGISTRQVRANLVRLNELRLIKTRQQLIKWGNWRKTHMKTVHILLAHEWMIGAERTRSKLDAEAEDELIPSLADADEQDDYPIEIDED